MFFFYLKRIIDRMKKALVFDIDGTLWDAAQRFAEAWDAVGMKSKYQYHVTKKQIVPCLGLPMSEFPGRLFPQVPLEDAKVLLKESLDYENEYLYSHPGNLYEGVKETLEKLKEKYDLLILSNCQLGYIDAFLAGTGLGYLFKDTICWGENFQPKSVNLGIILKRGGYEKAMYVGDTLYDEEETHKAGYKFAYASYGFGRSTNPDYVLKKFSDLIEVAEDALSE